MFVHELPTTGAISFADFVLTSGYSIEVAHTTEHRAKLRNVLKEHRKSAGDDNDLEQGDWLKVVQAVDEYLPYLLAMFNCVQVDEVIFKLEPEFSWRTTLSSHIFRSSPRISLRGLHYEVCAVLLLYGTALSNFAAAIVASLGNYELERTLQDAERKQRDDKLKRAADTFCQAAGIFEYLSQVMIPRWEERASCLDGRPPDLTREVTMALSKMALADAQLLSIRKLLSAAVSEANDFNTPGPPLPKGHPSASLLAKLYLNAASLYETASSLATTISKKGAVAANSNLAVDAYEDVQAKASKKPGKLLAKFKDAITVDHGDEVGSGLLTYLSASASVSRALAYKWLGIDAGENGERYGEGITFLRVAEENISIKKDRLNFSSSRSKSSRAELKTIQEQELKNVQHWLRAYTKMNDTVAFKPVPPASELQVKIPAGRAVLSVKTFELPPVKFGPGSENYTHRSIDAAHGLEGSLAAMDLQNQAKPAAAKYAGANAYY
ncbi:hypothetical protein K437DRAFT_255485 [Tilletiaria anomala UBC 951]|uniref:pH-response regulator protein palC n=1 Tax=Tilletiaria anomala (strain ATCC 24038 / CBS 436.72 / UBC 951) TaxID=1037660 RepID=A0A066WCK7_TILAU|nr:uncharacterized protein K437DRAFT_255485 [Tilletiaria anomala UBC 951]KDN48510.1 hypothetical protein K437DRAFT_255485 [Tilletiaria anomala UBC 951]